MKKQKQIGKAKPRQWQTVYNYDRAVPGFSEGATAYAKIIREAGLHARTQPSMYRGMVALVVAKGEIVAARRALRAYGIRVNW